MILTCCILLGLVALNTVGIHLREGKRWSIRKGQHSPLFNFFPLVLRNRKPGDVTAVNFELNATMMQSPPLEVDKLDWNKITGEGSLSLATLKQALNKKVPPHQISSWRVGWSYDDTVNKAKVGLYYYQAGQRREFIFTTFTPNATKEFSLSVVRTPTVTWFDLKDLSTGETNQFIMNTTEINGLVYRLRPYFGGNNTAFSDLNTTYQFH